MTPPAVADLAGPLRWSQSGLAKQYTFTAAARRQRRGGRPRTATAAATPPGRCWPRASRQSPPHHEQGISELAALGKQLVECLRHAGAAAVLTVIMAREHPAGCQESQRPADVLADSLGLVVAIDEDQPEAGFPGDHTPRARDAARRVDLVGVLVPPEDSRALAGALSRVLAGERPDPPSAGPTPGSSLPAQRPRYTPAPTASCSPAARCRAGLRSPGSGAPRAAGLPPAARNRAPPPPGARSPRDHAGLPGGNRSRLAGCS
jgi:hypothetical protein